MNPTTESTDCQEPAGVRVLDPAPALHACSSLENYLRDRQNEPYPSGALSVLRGFIKDAAGVMGTANTARKCLYCEREMIVGSECTSKAQSENCAMRDGVLGTVKEQR